jgi:colicin import membrane protein
MKKFFVVLITIFLSYSIYGSALEKMQTGAQKPNTQQVKKTDATPQTNKKEADKPGQGDKVVPGKKGPDGQAVYEGPKGGQYYIAKSGNKTYLKADDNVVPGKKGPDGQTVYSGPKGGQYYLKKNGDKVYLSPDKK